MRVLLLDDAHREAEALRLLLPRLVVARVVVAEDDDLVARLEIEAVRHQVVRLAGVARDDDLFRRHAQKLGERLARRLPWRPTAARGSAATGLRSTSSVSRVSASQHRAARPGRDWRRSSPPDRAASRTARARFSRTASPAAGAARRQRRRETRRLRPGRMRKERGRSADGEQPGEIAAGHGAGRGRCGHENLRRGVYQGNALTSGLLTTK